MDNDQFLDQMEKYYAQSDGVKDARPEVSNQHVSKIQHTPNTTLCVMIGRHTFWLAHSFGGVGTRVKRRSTHKMSEKGHGSVEMRTLNTCEGTPEGKTPLSPKQRRKREVHCKKSEWWLEFVSRREPRPEGHLYVLA